MFQGGQFVQLYLQLDSIIQAIRRTVWQANSLCGACTVTIKHALTGTPFTISHYPKKFDGLLSEIENHLPEYLKLLYDPKGGIWKLYQTHVPQFVIGWILVIVSIPLLDNINTFEIFNIFNMPVTVQDPFVPTDKLPSIVAWYRLETSSIAVNLAQMNYVLLTATEHCTFPLWHYCDVRSPVYSISSSKPCIVALFMKDTGNVKNYCKTEVESILFYL